MGYASTMDTYGTAVYGSNKKNELSTILIKCILQGGIVYLYCQGIVMNSVYVFNLVPQSSQSGIEVAASATLFIRLTFINGFLDLVLAAGKKYYCIQKRGNIVLVSSVILAVVHLLLCILFVAVLDYGIYGLALALTLSKVSDIAILMGYFLYRQESLSWSPIDRTVFHKWYDMVKLGLYGSFNVTAELLIYEAAAIASQFMGTQVTATWVITFQLSSLTFALSFGIVSAETIFVGKHLGMENTSEIKKWIGVGMVNSLLNSVSNALILYVFIGYFGRIFTDDKVVIATLSKWFWIISLKTVFDHTASYLTRGVLVAMGKQRNISIIIFAIGYGVIVPLIILLSCVTSLGAVGLFISIALYAVLFLISSIIYMSQIDLSVEIGRSSQRLNMNLGVNKATDGGYEYVEKNDSSYDEMDSMLNHHSISIWKDTSFKSFIRHLVQGMVVCFLLTTLSFYGDFKNYH